MAFLLGKGIGIATFQKGFIDRPPNIAKGIEQSPIQIEKERVFHTSTFYNKSAFKRMGNEISPAKPPSFFKKTQKRKAP
jgi:hypothetical protein